MNHSQSHRLNVQVMHPDPIVCAGVAAALRQHQNFDVSVRHEDDLAADGPHVDVVITDYDNAMRLMSLRTMSGRGGMAETRFLALTANDREADIRRAIRGGIHGYLLLGGSLDELTDAVWAVGMGVRFVCPIAAQRMADSLAGETLTQRENEVLRLVAAGQSNKAIARQLAIELGTVKSHVSAIMTKLGAISRTQAANIAVTRGLVDERGPYPGASHAPRTQLMGAQVIGAQLIAAQPQFA
jgi:DNA-binding NarL/FixJ family response regulator